MTTAESPASGAAPIAGPAGSAASGAGPGEERPAAGAGELSRRWAWAGLAAVLAGGLGLRLWGIGQGLPYAYNADEADHFVVHAVEMFAEGTLNPHYFANPPAYTYVLHFLFAAWLGGGAAVKHAFGADPTEVYTLARVAAAVLGTIALWLLYATGARLFGRGVGLLAAAIEAVAFLPVFYSHLALNDVPTLAPATLSLLGSAGVLRSGRPREYVVAGVGLGLACASKYTAGIVLLPFAAAAAARYLDASVELGSARAGRRALGGIALAGVSASAAFLIANPYAALDYADFHAELAHQSTLSAEAQGKLGAPKGGGLEYYLWTLTWGLGWAPALAALGGALSVFGRERVLGWLLVPAPCAYLLFMGLQGRYFGRWLLPIFPILCLLAAFFVVQLIVLARRRLARARVAWAAPLVAALLVAALLAQGLIYSVHSGKALARADTRNIARAWMVAHIPAGARIVVEPVAPDAWGRGWKKYPSLWSHVSASGKLEPGFTKEVGIEDYERTLAPALVGYYQRAGYCWVIGGSTESGRAYADPGEVPLAIAYYKALARAGKIVFEASPYARARTAVKFN
ncbi:MAG TPA: glycosyltransferase family 39 protein, partial [Solirubrobacteraceae bacterium]|nr:glycosyltransferase family 39 protein [Solirubrobacteraceae bacterium]